MGELTTQEGLTPSPCVTFLTGQLKMLNESKRLVGMPKGYILYPYVLTSIKCSLTNEPQTINQIVEKVRHDLALKQDQYPRTLSRDTVKSYLDYLVDQRTAKQTVIGARLLTYTLCSQKANIYKGK